MQPGLSARPFHLVLIVLASILLWPVVRSQPIPEASQTTALLGSSSRTIPHDHIDSNSNSILISARAIRDPSFLPAQIGGIVGAYGISLVLVAISLLALAKRRREHLESDEEVLFAFPQPWKKALLQAEQDSNGSDRDAPKLPHILTPTTVHIPGQTQVVPHSPVAPAQPAPGRDPIVDQTVVAADKAMAQQQLEDMYRHVMEHEDAKERGLVLDTTPIIPGSAQQQQQQMPGGAGTTEKASGKFFRKVKHKPSSLELDAAKEDRSQSKASAMFSALLSPKKKPVRGINISSPILTPMTASFPSHFESQEMSTMAPRHYAPVNPPPASSGAFNFGPGIARADTGPDASPASVQTIDERIGLALERRSRSTLHAPSEMDPGSAVSETSQMPLIGLPSSPKIGGRFPALPSSPKPGATFRRPSAPSAVRTNGTLPLRAYEEANGVPSAIGHTTKQTVFERQGPLSPGGGRTPLTANPVPYTPYQPYTPCIPMTPSLVTKEDRKRMRRMVPKTPTLAMVESSEEMW
ncbi:hypothetical protein ESCO_006526 [Escovopsis weberi]|uniref:Uncharacterized protein n=1 Tax=Escovopsis weberi TaxID=150374 RepID=A0A0N0RSY1_ESCWE|nr:hypothetical protein ESCO_006526 [Escovopsis weberi]